MLEGLAFLPVDDVSAGMAYLKMVMPDGLEPLVNYFDATYMSGSYSHFQIPLQQGAVVNPVLVRSTPAMFLPPLWNVHDATIRGESLVMVGTMHSANLLVMCIRLHLYLESH
ncbi:hypothetical protein NP493_111g01028 [Ridgeia piscesae]|uniref:Uncharacterized protein n=1 Tax=Ridgeia piscesae TaxID=27915 RepID=A0AAD9UH88_RIDPI|nr:hypothetical protein NP493_111g01028 [Ridgeia piscesae]